jgi:hypothetical protein
VALHPVEPDARDDLDLFVDELELPRGLERREIVGVIGRVGPLVRVHRVQPLEALERVARAREGRDERVAVPPRVPAGVVEVEVRVHDERDVFRSNAALRELAEELRRALDPVDAAELVAHLRARARLDDDDVIRIADEQAAHVHLDAVQCVGGLLLLPEHLRDHAEHRAAIELEGSVAEDVDLEPAQTHGGSMEKWRCGRTATATGIGSARSG